MKPRDPTASKRHRASCRATPRSGSSAWCWGEKLSSHRDHCIGWRENSQESTGFPMGKSIEPQGKIDGTSYFSRGKNKLCNWCWKGKDRNKPENNLDDLGVSWIGNLQLGGTNIAVPQQGSWGGQLHGSVGDISEIHIYCNWLVAWNHGILWLSIQ